MKRCLQCNRTFSDENSFCLIDGSTLVSDSSVAADMLTIISTTPLIQQPFPQPPSKQGSSVLIYLAVGLLALLIGGGIVALIKFTPDSSSSARNETGIKTSLTPAQKSTPDEIDEQREKLKAEQERLDREKQKLANERQALESKKKEALTATTQNQPPKTSDSGAAIVFAPPSNVRESPGGAILCSVRKRATINILGSTYAPDGVWYYTDVCGRTGVIHSGQVRF